MQGLDFSISARGKPERLPMSQFVNSYFSDVPIRSIFGFRERVNLYGGRLFLSPEISEADIRWMYDQNIGYRIPLQTIQANYKDYQNARTFLAKYHRKGNSVILVRHDLARWIREDFPLFEIEASVIHRIKNVTPIQTLLQTFDVIVLHPTLNDKPELLSSIVNKDRTRLFVNAGCMYSCPTMGCYKTIAAQNQGISGSMPRSCALHHEPGLIAQVHFHTFDLQELINLGFTKFKKLRSRGLTGF